MVAVSVDDTEQGQKLRERLSIDLPLYSDPEGAAASAWKVWDADTELALAATFVIAPGGEVIYRFIGSDKADRPPAQTLVDAIEDHKG